MSDPAWTRIAASAQAALAAVGQGARERKLINIAAQARISVPTLRTYLLAHRFIERLDAVDKAKALSIPVAALEIISRWHQYDPATALRRLRAFGAEKNSVRRIRGEEKGSRAGGRAAIAKRRESSYREFVKTNIAAFEIIWPAAGEIIWHSTPMDHFDRQPVVRTEPDDLSGKADFILRFGEGEAPPKLAVLIVGPYTSSYLYQARAADWCLRALGLTYFCKRVALVLPRNADAKQYVEFLASARDARKHIQLMRAYFRPEHRDYRGLNRGRSA